jgi:hypothetical protein
MGEYIRRVEGGREGMGDFPDITVLQSGGAGEARGEGGGLAVNFRAKWSVPRKVLVFGLFQASQSGVVSGRKLSRQSTKVFCTLPQGVGAEVKVFCTLPQGVGTEYKSVLYSAARGRDRGKSVLYSAARGRDRGKSVLYSAAKGRDGGVGVALRADRPVTPDVGDDEDDVRFFGGEHLPAGLSWCSPAPKAH